MSLWTMMFLVVFCGVLAQCFREWIRYRERSRDAGTAAGITAEEVEGLRQRIETLEAIVTDDGYDLRREIERIERG